MGRSLDAQTLLREHSDGVRGYDTCTNRKSHRGRRQTVQSVGSSSHLARSKALTMYTHAGR